MRNGKLRIALAACVCVVIGVSCSPRSPEAMYVELLTQSLDILTSFQGDPAAAAVAIEKYYIQHQSAIADLKKDLASLGPGHAMAAFTRLYAESQKLVDFMAQDKLLGKDQQIQDVVAEILP